MAAIPLNRAPDVQSAIVIGSNNSAIELTIGQNTGAVTLHCDQAFRFSFRSAETGGADATYSPEIVANTFFEVKVDKGVKDEALFVLVAAGSPAALAVISEP